MLSIDDLKTKVTPKLHGASLAKVEDIFGKLHEASGNLLARVRPYTIIRKVRIANAIYDHVYNYACADDLEVDAVIDIRPIGPRSKLDSLQGSFGQQFDIRKKENTFYVEYINGVKTLRLSKQLNPRTVLFEAESLTVGATVTGTGDVENLDLDYVDFISGSSSVKFELSGDTGQGIITIALDNTVDLSRLEGLGAVLPWFKFPLTSALTNVKLRVGTGASAYYESTITAALDRAFEDDAWMLLLQDLSTATKTGSPNFAAVNWLQIVVNYTSGTARTSVKLDNITAALGQAWEVVYYSNRLFTNAAGTTWKEIPTLNTDLIRLEGGLDNNCFMYEFLLTLQQELKGKNMGADFAYFQTQLYGKFGQRGIQLFSGLYDTLERKYPNQVVLRQVDYYEFGDTEHIGDWDEDIPSQSAGMPSTATGSVNIVTQYSLTASQLGSDAVVELSQLTHFGTLGVVVTAYRNQIAQTNGVTCTITASKVTFLNADQGEVFTITYTYT